MHTAQQLLVLHDAVRVAMKAEAALAVCNCC